MIAIWDLHLISGPHGVSDLFEVDPTWLLKAIREDFLLERRFLTGTDGVEEFLLYLVSKIDFVDFKYGRYRRTSLVANKCIAVIR